MMFEMSSDRGSEPYSSDVAHHSRDPLLEDVRCDVRRQSCLGASRIERCVEGFPCKTHRLPLGRHADNLTRGARALCRRSCMSS